VILSRLSIDVSQYQFVFRNKRLSVYAKEEMYMSKKIFPVIATIVVVVSLLGVFPAAASS